MADGGSKDIKHVIPQPEFTDLSPDPVYQKGLSAGGRYLDYAQFIRSLFSLNFPPAHAKSLELVLATGYASNLAKMIIPDAHEHANYQNDLRQTLASCIAIAFSQNANGNHSGKVHYPTDEVTSSVMTAKVVSDYAAWWIAGAQAKSQPSDLELAGYIAGMAGSFLGPSPVNGNGEKYQQAVNGVKKLVTQLISAKGDKH